MECSCSVNSGFDGDGGAWGEQKRRAAKPHKCFECGSDIKKGEHYWFHTIFYEGSISNFKVCTDCESVINQFFKDGWRFGSVRSNLEDYLHDNWQEDLPSSCISKLSPIARDYVCDQLQGYQEQ